MIIDLHTVSTKLRVNRLKNYVIISEQTRVIPDTKYLPRSCV